MACVRREGGERRGKIYERCLGNLDAPVSPLISGRRVLNAHYYHR